MTYIDFFIGMCLFTLIGYLARGDLVESVVGAFIAVAVIALLANLRSGKVNDKSKD